MELLSRPSERATNIFHNQLWQSSGKISALTDYGWEYTPVFKKNTLIFSGAQCVSEGQPLACCERLFEFCCGRRPALQKGIL